MPKRSAPEINAGSMADIAFLLLIFFLVTTTMGGQSGINRKLPPKMDDNYTPPPINKRNILEIQINAQKQILVEGESYVKIDEISDIVEGFIDNNGKGECTYCKGLKDTKSSDSPIAANVQIEYNAGTPYDFFIKVQNEIEVGYNNLRNRYSKEKYGVLFTLLDEAEQKEERKAVREAYPLNLIEKPPVE